MSDQKLDARNYSIDEFMKMELPEASILVDENLGNSYIGPFTQRLIEIKKSFGTHFPELVPLFRKLDILRASEDKQLIVQAAQTRKTTIKSLLSQKKVPERLARIKTDNASHKLTNEMGGKNFSKELIAQNARAWSYTYCHEKVSWTHNVRIPELDEIFKKLDKYIE